MAVAVFRFSKGFHFSMSGRPQARDRPANFSSGSPWRTGEVGRLRARGNQRDACQAPLSTSSRTSDFNVSATASMADCAAPPRRAKRHRADHLGIGEAAVIDRRRGRRCECRPCHDRVAAPDATSSRVVFNDRIAIGRRSPCFSNASRASRSTALPGPGTSSGRAPRGDADGDCPGRQSAEQLPRHQRFDHQAPFVFGREQHRHVETAIVQPLARHRAVAVREMQQDSGIGVAVPHEQFARQDRCHGDRKLIDTRPDGTSCTLSASCSANSTCRRMASACR